MPAPAVATAPFDAARAKEHQDAWAKYLGVLPEITNSIGMKLRLIPPGQFLMGTPASDTKGLLAAAAQEKILPHESLLISKEGIPHSVRMTQP